MQFFTFFTPWKTRFWINEKFEIYFFWKYTWKFSHSPKTNIFKCHIPSHILSSTSAGKILKMAIKSELLGLSSWNFVNLLFSMRLSNSEYFKNFKFFDLTWIWWIWLEWPNAVFLKWKKCRKNVLTKESSWRGFNKTF